MGCVCRAAVQARSNASTHTHTHTHIHMYTYTYNLVCLAAVQARSDTSPRGAWITPKKKLDKWPPLTYKYTHVYIYRWEHGPRGH